MLITFMIITVIMFICFIVLSYWFYKTLNKLCNDLNKVNDTTITFGNILTNVVKDNVNIKKYLNDCQNSTADTDK
jgi:uncharacterized membrane protein YedE/YeeE